MPQLLPTSRRALVALSFAALLGAAAPQAAFAYEASSKAAANVDGSGLAIKGYDPVAYFTIGAPTQGQAKFTASHSGATYHFSSAENRTAFLADPEKYVPAYGGFCAYAASLSKKADVDPTAWRIVEGKLYLNYNHNVQTRWLEDVPGNVTKATKSWPVIKDKAPSEL